jgi:hypothetical protein
VLADAFDESEEMLTAGKPSALNEVRHSIIASALRGIGDLIALSHIMVEGRTDAALPRGTEARQ